MTDIGLKVGIVGPSRVGKTSLLTTVLYDSDRALSGYRAQIRPASEETANLLAAQRREMATSIHRRHFDPGNLESNTEKNRFHLELGVGKVAIGLEFLDYPGGWLSPETRGGGDWEACKQFLLESSVVLVPIDSAVLMEAYLREHDGEIPRLLGTTDVEELLREWARTLVHETSHPGLVLLVPLKCESYFSDNHGARDRSGELLNVVNKFYGDALRAVEQEDRESNRIRVLYAPVDTYGCVEVCRPKWVRGSKGDLSFSAEYRVRTGSAAMQPYGAENLLYAVCSHLLGIAAASREGQAGGAQSEMHEYLGKLRDTSGWFLKLVTKISGHRKDWEAATAALSALLGEHKEDAEQLHKLVVELTRQELTTRAKYLR